MQALHVDRADGVEDALQALLAAPGPALLHVAIDQAANVWPLVPPNHNNAQMLDPEAGCARPPLPPPPPRSPAMRYQLDLTLRQAEGALARVLGAAERRGFRPLAVDGEAQPDGDRWYLRLTVEGDRADASLQTPARQALRLPLRGGVAMSMTATQTQQGRPSARQRRPCRCRCSTTRAAATTPMLWFDGELATADSLQAPLTTHAMHYGTGVFEGIRSYATRDGAAVFRLPEHLERMRKGAELLGLDFDVERALPRRRCRRCAPTAIATPTSARWRGSAPARIGLDVSAADASTSWSRRWPSACTWPASAPA